MDEVEALGWPELARLLAAADGRKFDGAERYHDTIRNASPEVREGIKTAVLYAMLTRA
jgi:hypothetical protein